MPLEQPVGHPVVGSDNRLKKGYAHTRAGQSLKLVSEQKHNLEEPKAVAEERTRRNNSIDRDDDSQAIT